MDGNSGQMYINFRLNYHIFHFFISVFIAIQLTRIDAGILPHPTLGHFTHCFSPLPQHLLLQLLCIFKCNSNVNFIVVKKKKKSIILCVCCSLAPYLLIPFSLLLFNNYVHRSCPSPFLLNLAVYNGSLHLSHNLTSIATRGKMSYNVEMILTPPPFPPPVATKIS